MGERLSKITQALWGVKPHERLKMVISSAIFFFIIASYTLTKELKDSIFIGITGGKEYIPHAKIITLIGLIPLVLLYAKIVDVMRRYQVLCFFACVYGCFCFLFAYLLGHPTIGLSNTQISTYRFFGWSFYFFIESFSPFIIGVFWAFLNSISSPGGATRTYGMVIAGSKVGGVMASGLAWLFFSMNSRSPVFSDALSHQLVMIISALLIFMVPVLVTYMMNNVPGMYLHGYEAAYQFEKKQSKEGGEETGLFSGLIMLLRYPYMFGIFCTVFFYEIMSSVLSYQRLGIATDTSGGICGVSCFLFKMVFFVHLIGLIFVLFGTRAIISVLGERNTLFVTPLLMGSFILYFLYSNSPTALLSCYVAFRGIHYALNEPSREMLYIPTVKDMKFKSKAWIDTFGKKFARSAGSGFNICTELFGASARTVHIGFFGLILGLWTMVAYFLGKRFDNAVKNNVVIGVDEA